MTNAPYTFPHKSRAAIAEYLTRDGRAYDYRRYNFAWDVKTHGARLPGRVMRPHARQKCGARSLFASAAAKRVRAAPPFPRPQTRFDDASATGGLAFLPCRFSSFPLSGVRRGSPHRNSRARAAARLLPARPAALRYSPARLSAPLLAFRNTSPRQGFRTSSERNCL